MNEELVNLLSTFGYPVIQQGSMGEDEAYPDSLFTFYNIDTPDDGFYDNNLHVPFGHITYIFIAMTLY